MNETLTRALSGVLYIFILVTATLFLDSFLVLFALLLMLSVYEYCELVKLQKAIPILIALVSYYLFTNYFVDARIASILVVCFLVIAIKALMYLFTRADNKINLVEKYGYLVGYIIIPFILLGKLPFVETLFNPKIVISLFILIWFNDTMAYVVGKSIGKTKLFERVSPKKTIEGFLGGLIFSALISIFIAKYYIYQPVAQWIIIALIVGIFGTLGDLIESKFKRTAGVKDSGKIMPGHGGILDRLDSIIFAGPFVFLFYQILNYVS
ncbi:MAG: phosphatidate cytidylyltransferase [Flavobacterium sp.]|nr:phosphatidate cytidylyltransferase [Flavobacterium sp.]